MEIFREKQIEANFNEEWINSACENIAKDFLNPNKFEENLTHLINNKGKRTRFDGFKVFPLEDERGEGTGGAIGVKYSFILFMKNRRPKFEVKLFEISICKDEVMPDYFLDTYNLIKNKKS